MKLVLRDVTYVLLIASVVIFKGIVMLIGWALLGWLWAIRILAGKVKIGPHDMWEDSVARRDFGARRTELKMAIGILVCYVSFAVLLLSVFLPHGVDDLSFGISLTSMTVSFLTLFGAGALVIAIWRTDWDHIAMRLRVRQVQPTLF